MDSINMSCENLAIVNRRFCRRFYAVFGPWIVKTESLYTFYAQGQLKSVLSRAFYVVFGPRTVKNESLCAFYVVVHLMII